jgi:hypothetical protein
MVLKVRFAFGSSSRQRMTHLAMGILASRKQECQSCVPACFLLCLMSPAIDRGTRKAAFSATLRMPKSSFWTHSFCKAEDAQRRTTRALIVHTRLHLFFCECCIFSSKFGLVSNEHGLESTFVSTASTHGCINLVKSLWSKLRSSNTSLNPFCPLCRRKGPDCWSIHSSCDKFI